MPLAASRSVAHPRRRGPLAATVAVHVTRVATRCRSPVHGRPRVVGGAAGSRTRVPRSRCSRLYVRRPPDDLGCGAPRSDNLRIPTRLKMFPVGRRGDLPGGASCRRPGPPMRRRRRDVAVYAAIASSVSAFVGSSKGLTSSHWGTRHAPLAPARPRSRPVSPKVSCGHEVGASSLCSCQRRLRRVDQCNRPGRREVPHRVRSVTTGRTPPGIGPRAGRPQAWRRSFRARSISRLASRAFRSLRLSATFLLRAVANSSLARPPRK